VPGFKEEGIFTQFPGLYTGISMTCVPAPWPGTTAALRQEAKVVLKALELARKFGGLLP